MSPTLVGGGRCAALPHGYCVPLLRPIALSHCVKTLHMKHRSKTTRTAWTSGATVKAA
jgi:hypothetical protein